VENYVAIQLLNLTQGTAIKFTRERRTCTSAAMHHYNIGKTGGSTFCFPGIQYSKTWPWSSHLHTTTKTLKMPWRHFKK